MKKLPKRFLTQVDELIEEYLNEPDLLPLLTQQLYLSYSQVYRKVKQKTGYSPAIYIRKKRLATAQEWIKESDAQISEIAYETGFQSLNYFSRCFLDEFGTSPTRFRKSQKENVIV